MLLGAYVDLKEYKDFYTYTSMIKRSEELVNIIIDECIPAPNVDISDYKNVALKKSDANLPKVDKLIEYGLIHKGDNIYITLYSDTSKATLISEKYVEFNGNKMTLNERGYKVTGWKSIRIYVYTAIVCEIETLQDKRIKYIQKNNEN